MYQYNMDKQLFCEKPKEIETKLNKKLIIDDIENVLELKNAVALPIKKRANGANEGGICNSNGNFVAGFYRNMIVPEKKDNGHNCLNSYKIDNTLIIRNETVIFGGMLFNHFGHFIRDSLVRLWYIFENRNINHKIIFIIQDGLDEIKHENILELAGLKKEEYEILVHPTQFDKIIVPYQSFDIFNGYRKNASLPFDAIISKITPANYDKIYISKSKYDNNSLKNEIYFENFYKKRGFKIIYPETLPFAEQISIINGANEIICSSGTIAHLASYFCQKNSKITILWRNDNVYQNLIDNAPVWLNPLQMRGCETYIVDVSFNFYLLELLRGFF